MIGICIWSTWVHDILKATNKLPCNLMCSLSHGTQNFTNYQDINQVLKCMSKQVNLPQNLFPKVLTTRWPQYKAGDWNDPHHYIIVICSNQHLNSTHYLTTCRWKGINQKVAKQAIKRLAYLVCTLYTELGKWESWGSVIVEIGRPEK